MNDCLTERSAALSGADHSTLFVAQPFINTIEPGGKTRFGLKDLLTALTAGLAIIPAIGEGVSAAAKAGLTVLETGL